ncbi:MAG: murein biosynthesis integral membrane protein MurJ [Desulfuromonadales bacterium]|nr:murein biosynthesis integral membrane protein MurJ [Desulfuromonadales bacterium]
MSENRNIAKAAGVLGFATILSRVMGMARDIVVSRLFGAGYATDAFFAAFLIPNILRRFFAEGALTSAFIPTFSLWYTNNGKDSAKELANICFTLLTIIVAGVTILGITFSPLIIHLIFPGYGVSHEKVALTVFLNRLMFPYIFFVSLVALCMGILNTVRHFFTPAISTIFLNISIIFCAVFLRAHFRVPIYALAVGVLFGGMLQLLLQLPVLYHKGFSIKPNFHFNHPAVKKIALLMGPAVFGVGVYYLNIAVGSILASYLPEGSVSYLNYAQRLFEFPQGIFTVSVAQAVLPSMSKQAAEGDIEALKDSLQFGLRLIIFSTIPAMIGLMVTATPIFSFVYMGGVFTYAKAVQCSIALFYYSIGLAFVAMVRVLAPAFYALKDTRTPVFVAFIAFLLNFMFSLLLMRPLLHGGLALASSLSAFANMLLLLYMLRRKIGRLGIRKMISSVWKSVLAGLPAGLVAYLIVNLYDWSQTGAKFHKGFVLGSGIMAAIIIYIALSLLLKSEEAVALIKFIRNKFSRAT